MFTPNCDKCEHRAECVIVKANQEMRETLWNLGREQSGRHDFILNGKYYPAEEGE